MSKYIKFVLGFLILISGIIIVFNRIDNKILIYILIGFSCLILGRVAKKIMAEIFDYGNKNPEIKKTNKQIYFENLARSKAYTLMVYLYGILLIAFVIMGIEIKFILPLTISYLFIQIYALCLRAEYEKY